MLKSWATFADETTAPVLDIRDGDERSRQLWAYARDDRPWGRRTASSTSMRPTTRRHGQWPTRPTSKAFCDGYAGYRVLAERGDVELAFCWSHVRRRFYELAAAGPAPIASEVLKRIGRLYAVEKDIRGRSARSAVRRPPGEDRPIVDDL